MARRTGHQCFTDAELTAWLDGQGIGPGAVDEAVRAARSTESIRNEVYEDMTAESRRELAAERQDMASVHAEERSRQADESSCPWEVRRRRVIPQEAWDEGFHFDSPEDAYEYGPCGDPVAPGARHGMCPIHEEAMAMDGVEFEAAVEDGTSWSGM
jgi:hypothetical protein